MKKVIKKMLLFFIIIILAITTYLVFFFQLSPQLGGSPKGERLTRIKASSNYRDKRFQNTTKTSMGIKDGKLMFKAMVKMIFGVPNQSPKIQIKSQAFDNRPFEEMDKGELGLTWFGHSSVILKLEGKTILFDPIIGKRVSMFSYMGPKQFDYSHHLTSEELPEIDLLIISHDHYDHLDYPAIKQLKDKVKKFYVPLGVGAHLEKWGVGAEKITEADWWDEMEVEGLKLVCTPARHFSGRAIRDRQKTLWASWVVIGSKKRVIFTGDSGYTPEFKKIGNKYGPFDLAMVECGQYNKAWEDIHMMPEDTAQVALDLQSDLLIPIHWGKYVLSIHAWKEPVERMRQKAEELGVSYLTPEPGKLYSISKETVTPAWWEQY